MIKFNIKREDFKFIENIIFFQEYDEDPKQEIMIEIIDSEESFLYKILKLNDRYYFVTA